MGSSTRDGSPKERSRMRVLEEYGILDTEADPAFDEIVQLAAEIANAPIALITFLDEERQWFKARHGLELKETPRAESFCHHAIGQGELYVVPDALVDERHSHIPLVTGPAKIRFYAGAPLISPGGHALGTLCILDSVPRSINPVVKRMLETLSRQVVHLLELHRRTTELSRAVSRFQDAEQRNTENARRYAMVMEGIRDGLWDWNLETNEVHYSTQWKAMLGYGEDEVENHFTGWERLVHPDDKPGCLAFIEAYQRGEIPNYQMEHRLRHKDGRYRWILTRGLAVRDASGRPVRMAGSHTDITERKEHEAILALQRRAMDAASDGIALLNKNSEYIYLNESHATLFGYREPGELIGRSWKTLYSAEEVERMEREVFPKLVQDRKWQGEAVATRKDGTRFHEGVSLTLLEDGGLICVCRDVTQEKAAELRVRRMNLELEQRVAERTAELSAQTQLVAESEQRLRLITERIPQVFWIRQPGPNPSVFTSPAYETIWGKNPRSLQEFPASFLDSIHPADRDRVQKAVELQDKGENTEMEYRIIRPDGSIRWIWDRGFAIRNDEGVPMHVCGLAEDVTEHKQAEHQTHLYQQQLRRMASQLLRSEERERRRIATEIHDHIGQTLAVCRMKIEEVASNLAGNRSVGTPQTEQTQSLEKVSGLLEKTIQQTRTLTFQLSPPVLHELGLAHALQWLLEKTSSETGIRVSYQGESTVEPLHPDLRVLLFRIAGELLNNVVKHAKASQVTIQLERGEKNVELEVVDDGTGFDDAMQQQSKIAGFGLFSIRDRLRFIGGHLEIQSKPNEGTRARVVAPLHGTEENPTLSTP